MKQDGTVFAATQRPVVPPAGQEDAVLNKFLVNTQLNNSTFSDAILQQLDTYYPTPAGENGTYQGPFVTGFNLFDRLSALFTDVYFSSHMKMLLSANSQKGKSSFGYLWDQLVPAGGVPQELGGKLAFTTSRISAKFGAVYHGTNLVYVLGQVTDPSLQSFVQQYQDYYINFINSLNPGEHPFYTWPPCAAHLSFCRLYVAYIQHQRPQDSAPPEWGHFNDYRWYDSSSYPSCKPD